jgi:transposase-like protein
VPGRSSRRCPSAAGGVGQAPFAVVVEAYLHGVGTRKVDDLVRALGAGSGTAKSEVSRTCAGLDQEVG